MDADLRAINELTGKVSRIKAGPNGELFAALRPFTPGATVSLPAAATIAAGTQKLTSNGTAPSDADTVTIGTTTYTFKTTLSTNPTVPYEVLIGVSAAVALDNLKSAINASAGAGTTYGEGTVAHPLVTATTNTNTEQTVEAKTTGVIAAIPTTKSAATLSWGAATLEGATGRIAVGAGPSVVIRNTGSKTAYVKFGTSTVAATTSDYPIAAGTQEVIARLLTDTHLSAICGGSDTTTLSITPGSGTPQFLKIA